MHGHTVPKVLSCHSSLEMANNESAMIAVLNNQQQYSFTQQILCIHGQLYMFLWRFTNSKHILLFSERVITVICCTYRCTFTCIFLFPFSCGLICEKDTLVKFNEFSFLDPETQPIYLLKKGK